MNLSISDSAKHQLVNLLADAGEAYIRFGLKGGGCSGFSYYLSFDADGPAEDDHVIDVAKGTNFTIEGKLLVDSMSAMYLDGATIDYKKDLMGESFVFNNPNTTTRCGCGNSVGF